jgi:hypothetical protein
MKTRLPVRNCPARVGTVAALSAASVLWLGCGQGSASAAATDYPQPPTTPSAVCLHHRSTTPAPMHHTSTAQMSSAAAEVDSHLRARYPRYYTGLIPCMEKGTLIVYRVPGSRGLDRDLRSVGARHNVAVDLVDSKFSHRTLVAAEDFVSQKADKLAAAGAAWKSSSIEPWGLVCVGVTAHPDRALRILSEIADRIDVQVDRGLAVPA